jgi:hypothetical protein
VDAIDRLAKRPLRVTSRVVESGRQQQLPRVWHQAQQIDRGRSRPPAIHSPSWLMVNGELPCSMNAFDTSQKVLMEMNRSNIDHIVMKFNEDSTQSLPYFIAHVMTAVAGSRRISPELIRLMTKISDSRGYSAMLIQIENILSQVKRWLQNHLA